MLKMILIGLAVIVAVVIGVGLIMPTEYRIEESVEIGATPAQVHALVGDLERWEEWTPWGEEDPAMQTTHGPITKGVGASQTWSGKDGDGELTFTRCDEQTGIAYDMAFIMEGARAPATSAMDYSVSGGTTTVTWTMEGDVASFMPKVLAGLMNPMMKRSISGMFQKGLNTLKQKAEAEPIPEPEPVLTEQPEVTM